MSSDSPSSAKQSTTTDGESSGGFKSFWKKSDRSNGSQRDVKFVSQDPGAKRKSNRLSRLFRGDSQSTGSPEDGDSGTAGKRRQQVYQAQKRHRNRKAEYVQSLESEVAKLQHLDALVNSEKNQLAQQNEAMRQLLAAQSIDVQLEGFNLGTQSNGAGDEDLNMLDLAAVDIRYDPQMGGERTFIDFNDPFATTWTSSDTSEAEPQPRPRKQHGPVKGDSWAALDFILALEHPCRDHIYHPGIHPKPKSSKAPDPEEFHGHALTATQAVFSSSLPPPNTSSEHATLLASTGSQHGVKPNKQPQNWQLPHSEIDKLVGLSENLQLDDEQMTPAQLYSALRQELPRADLLRPVLEALKTPLASLVQCQGFGAVLATEMFYQHLDAVAQTLDFTIPQAT